MSYMLGVDSDGRPVYGLGPRPTPSADVVSVVEVTITGVADCDLCSDHYVWKCPDCPRHYDHFQETNFPLNVKCECGTVSRITEREAERWRRDVLGVDDSDDDDEIARQDEEVGER